jgi:zinc protease
MPLPHRRRSPAIGTLGALAALLAPLVLPLGNGRSALALAAPPTKTSAALTSTSTSASATKPNSEIQLELAVERYTLGNGLRVVVNRETASPTVAVVVWYDVGSRDEKEGEGGFAHLFEHMMFEGSAHVPRGVHDQLTEGRGGENNAATSEDWTRYYERMPSSELPVTLFLESDRMRALAIDEERFENQRKVVEEEYRLRVSNKPYVPGYFRLRELIFEGFSPYAHPAIGSMKELDAAKLEWVKRFHDQWYAPNNAVLVIAGDVDLAETRRLVEKYFGAIPRAATPTRAPFENMGRTTPSGPETLVDAMAATPMVYFGWGIPGAAANDHVALEVAASVLADGDSSRLTRKLVRESSMAQSVEAETEDHRGPDAFVIGAQFADKAKVDDVEKAIWAELDDLAKHGPTEQELARAKAKIEHGFVFGLQTNVARAFELAKMEGERGDARLLSRELARYRAVTASEVRAVVAKYLVRGRLAHVRILPKPAPKPAASTSAAPKAGKP